MDSIVIVGGGLAGLVCAKVLHEAGASFELLEASDGVGGRVRTDEIDGFLLDRGFQVLLDNYPAARRHLNFDALEARPFDSGALLWDSGDFFRVMNPLHHAQWFASSLLNPAFPLSDGVRLASLAFSAILHSDASLLARCASPDDESIREHLARLRFGDDIFHRFFVPFFGGIFLDEELRSSAGLFSYYLKKFATGRAVTPRYGIGEIPKQLASRVPADSIHLNTPVRSVGAGSVLLEDGRELSARRIILATDEPSTRRLLNLPAEPARPALGVDTVYFASSRSLYTGRMLVLPTGHRRTVRHLAQLTNVSRKLAPKDRHLISATVLRPHGFDDASLIRAAQTEVEHIFTEAHGALEPLRIVHVPCALPAQPPGFAARLTPPPTPAGVILAGDQLGAASIQSAMESGERAAQAALAM
jgi:phytoene dehydrogenase-like protein